MKKNKKNNILEWFLKEGAVSQEGNVYVAPRAFVANSIVSWVKRKSPTLKQDEIEYVMKIIRLFLQKQLDLKWADDKIEILSTMIEDVKVTDSKVQTKGIK